MVYLLALLTALAPFGGLYITSLPAGADVWIDGSYIGRTPLLVDGLHAGKHAVTITKTGWQVEEIQEDVSAGSTIPTTVQLTAIKPPPAYGTLELHGLQPDAQIFVDGDRPKPLEPRYRLRNGMHHLTVREPAARFERDVRVYGDETTHVLFPAPVAATHAAMVAPVADYMPASAAKVSGGRLLLRWGGHVVSGHLGDGKFVVDGRDVVYDAPAGMVSGRLYLPLDLIQFLTGKSK